MQTHGFVHSYETFGTKDTPELDLYTFCKVATFVVSIVTMLILGTKEKKTKMSVDEAFHEIEKSKRFYKIWWRYCFWW